jgi:hypothetical protein
MPVSQPQAPSRVDLQGRAGDQLRLVKAALAAFALVKRHRYDEHGLLLEAGFNGRDRLCQPLSKETSRRAHPVVLQQMDQLSQPAVIAAEGGSPRERAIDAAAHRAQPETGSVRLGITREHALSANRAEFSAERLNLIQAIEANRQPGNIQQRQAAKAAVGRKQNRKYALGRLSGPVKERRGER